MVSTGAVMRPTPVLDERVRFPPELPITARLDDLARAIAEHQVVIVAGETGSGKTTQLPKLCLAMGRGQRGQIACTQPRRIAASSVATRVAQELDTELGDVVGYKIRFNDRSKSTSAIKFMTDGIVLAELHGDPLLRRYDTLIIDEAHERSLNIDFLLGYIKRTLPRRPDLRVIVSSATLATERFAEFFAGRGGPAPVVEVSGRTYPVDVLYRPPREDEVDLADAVANTVNEITELDPRGDVLVFLPGEREIREAAGELERRALPHTMILPLYARLSAAEQQRVFQRLPQRRVVLATNVAETSLTIPGIVYVVDGGLARINRYSVRTGVTQLHIEPISQASAEQRKGRCGRVESGICFRLYEEQDFASRPAYTDPEIKRVGLAGVILRMKALDLGDVATFPFLDPPHRRAIDEGYRTLEELGAIDERGALTDIGEQLGRMPIDPRLARMVIGGRDEGVLRDVLVIAAALGLQDPRERPRDAQQKADEAQRPFRDEASDFAGYLKLWDAWQEVRRAGKGGVSKFCREKFLSYPRMREWEDVHDQLTRVVRELGFRVEDEGGARSGTGTGTGTGSSEKIHRALLPGLLSKIGMWNQEARVYVGARAIRFALHPSSGLAKKPPPWVMAAELVETTQLYARTVAKLDPAWIERAAGPLVRRNHGSAHWEQRAGQAMCKEQVTLFGLPVANRKVPYGPFDAAAARDLFITHALVRGEYTSKGAFMEHNRRLLDEAQRLRDKARRSDMVADEDALADFFDRRLPPDVWSGALFETWRKQAEAKDPSVLKLTLHDILLDQEHELSPARYPDELLIGGARVPLAYRFEPGEDDDGITATVPLALLPQLDPDVMAWTIPGWHETKLLALLESLPKALRKSLAPLGELAAALAVALKPFAGPMLPVLERAIFERTDVRVPRDAWDLRSVPAYLTIGFRVTDEQGKELAHGRDLEELQRTLAARAQALWGSAPRAKLERTGVTSWDFDALPASITLDVGGHRLPAYPALVDRETSVELKLLESAEAAATATRAGLARLFMLGMGTTLTKLEGALPQALSQGPLAVAGAPTPRRQLVLRALDEAFELRDAATFPRTKAAFTERLALGRGRVTTILGQLGGLAVELGAELTKVKALLKPLAGKPGLLKVAHEDLTAQLEHLVPPELLRTTSEVRLVHIVRYLQGMQVRLQRLANDPPKDAAKAAPVVPLWQAWRREHAAWRARGRKLDELEELGWLIEELRVAIFAPELRTPVPVSLARVHERWSAVTAQPIPR